MAARRASRVLEDEWDRIGKDDEALAELQTAFMVNP